MLKIIFLSYNYPVIFIRWTKIIIGLVIVTKKNKKNKVGWDGHISIVR
jgi:hypothetical protein